MKHLIIFSVLTVVLASCKTHYKSTTRASEESVYDVKTGKPTAKTAPKPASIPPPRHAVAKVNQPVEVEVIKQLRIGESIESFVANVYRRKPKSNFKSYIAAKIPCRAQLDPESKVGTVNCEIDEYTPSINIEIERHKARIAKLNMPGTEEQAMNCKLTYDYESDHSHGPEATRSGTVLHRLQEVNCL